MRTLIVRLFSLMVLFTVGFGLCAGKLLQTHEINEAYSVTTATATQIYNDQLLLVSGLEQLVTTISFLPAVQSHNRSDSEHILSALVAANAKITNILIADTQGLVWASALPQTGAVTSVADRRFFKNALTSGVFSSGEYMVGRISGTPVFAFAYPAKNVSGTISDIIIVTVPLDMYSQFTTNRASSVALVDHKGTILYSSVSASLAGKQDRPDLFTIISSDAGRGSFEGKGNLGIERFFSYRAMRLKHEKVPYLYVRTGLDKAEVLNKSYWQIGYMVALFSGLLILLFGMTVSFSKRKVFGQLAQIENAADNVVHGDGMLRVSDQLPSGELSGIVRVFDEMADKHSNTIHALQYSDAALKESEKNYRELVEKARTLILKMDRGGNITFFNEYAQSFFGFSEQELLGRSVVGTIVPETESSGRNLQDMIANLIENPVPFTTNTNENMRKNGERRWISWSNHKLEDAEGKYLGVLSVGQDVTERKKIEEALQASEQLFRSFVENVNDVIFVLSASGMFTYVSPQWKTAFGYEISEVVGHPFAPFVHPDDVTACFNFLTLVMETGKSQRGVEYRVLHKNGTWVSYTANGSCLTNQDGSLSFVGIGRDITDQKLIQKERLKTQKLESISFLAAGIAHNFNNVLTGVIGYISFARKHLTDHNKVGQLLEAAEKSSFRAAELARQLLEFSKGVAPLRAPNSAEKLVEESLSLLLSGSRIEGLVENRAARMIDVDSGQINQAFNNIVLNSMSSMPTGGSITVQIEDCIFEKGNIYLLEAGEYVKITFIDSGCGIEKEHLHKVFDPYFTTRPDGTGLGLSTTQAVVTKHGGYIDIASVVKQGTTVTIILPACHDTSCNSDLV